MIRYQIQHRIRRSPAEVYDFVVVHQEDNHPKWEEEVVAVRRPGKPAVGLKGVMVRKEGGRTRDVPFEITDLVPDRLMAVRSGSGGFQLELIFDMRPAEGGETDFHVDAALTLSGPLWLLTPIFKRQFPKISARITERLASLLNDA